MKTTLVAMMAFLSFNAAKADGFKCEGVNTGIEVKVYNHTDPSKGTRNPAIMIVSDSYVNRSNKTIATFSDENNTLAYLGYGNYQAKVDLRYLESDKKGENIAGTKLGQLKNINLQVYTSTPIADETILMKRTSNDPLKNGQAVDAIITYLKRNGETIEEKAMCTRYLKN